MRCFILLFILVSLQHGSGQHVQTEHTLVEEWRRRDNLGNADSGGYEYSEVLGEEDEDYDYEYNNNDSDWAQAEAEGEAEDEQSCEYSCPRYYRPVCVLRNGRRVTYATPCEFYNEVRCASVRRRLGQSVPDLHYQHSGAC